MADDEALRILQNGQQREWLEFLSPRAGSGVPVNLTGADLNGMNLRSFLFLPGTNLDGANLCSANLEFSNLQEVSLKSASFEGCFLTHATLAKADLSRAHLRGAKLRNTSLKGARLEGADLSESDLEHADLTGVIVDDFTQLANARVSGCRIERRTLIRIPNFGGLTAGQMMDMDIIDPVAKLRSYYSGFWQWIHLTALALFLGPYAFFLGRRYVLASVVPSFLASDDTVPLWRALASFVWTGGTGDFAPLMFGTFCFSVLYNVLRVVLLFKTKTLELREQASGLPAPFSLSGPWGRLLSAAQIGFFLNVALVLYHTGHFLQMRVPR